MINVIQIHYTWINISSDDNLNIVGRCKYVLIICYTVATYNNGCMNVMIAEK